MIDPTTLNWQKDSSGLLPTIVQDAQTDSVLMLGYMNQAALVKSIETKLVTFFSRSKNRLWQKGETSGNTLTLVSIDADCDNDALLVRAIPNGPTCHTGSQSCFANADELPLETIGQLLNTISNRSNSNDENSYTKKLLDGGIDAYGAKVLEEAEELVRAARDEGKQRTIEEAADLLYHTFVLLQGQSVSLEEVAKEFRKRRKAE